MPENKHIELWENYKTREMAGVLPFIVGLGFVLDEDQVQIGGERYLLSGQKLVLTGQRASDSRRVIIKVSSKPDGIREIERERECRAVLHKINFAYHTFLSPEEIMFLRQDPYAILITGFVEQEKNFISRPLEEQFFLALRALEAQEGAHATTYEHAKTIKSVFGMTSAQEYIDSFRTFKEGAISSDSGNKELSAALEKAYKFLNSNKKTIERYSGFLTHHDFVPHNLRVSGRDIYLLDHTSIYFGNKYEGWARFINFMTQFNPALEKTLTQYVRLNRGEEEYLCLRLMRTYKLGFLLKFHTASLSKTSGSLNKMVRLRISFWTRALEAILDDKELPEEEAISFRGAQEKLRGDEERKRHLEISARQ